MSNAEFLEWKARQPQRFDFVDGRPMARPETEQSGSRIARVRRVASDILSMHESAEAWLAEPHPALGGLEPSALAIESEAGCQAVLRLLASLRRQGVEEV